VFAVVIVAVVKADCHFFTAVEVVVIIAAVGAVYFSSLLSWGDHDNRHHCHCKGGRLKGHPLTLSRERGKGGVYSLSTAVMGGMTPTIVATAERGIAERGIFLTSSWEREKGRVVFPPR
jgi:hypothetical protein